jgi:hypothetical protein
MGKSIRGWNGTFEHLADRFLAFGLSPDGEEGIGQDHPFARMVKDLPIA